MSFTSLELLRPWWLIALAVIPLIVWLFRRSLVDFHRRQKLASLVCRTIIVVLLVLSLAGLTLIRPTQDLFVVFAVDRSAGISTSGDATTRQFLAEALARRGNADVAIVEFAKTPSPVRRIDGADDVAKVTASTDAVSSAENDDQGNEKDDQSGDTLPADLGTNIAAALDVAAATMPPSRVKRIVLLSDGNETIGDAVKTAAGLDDVTIFTVPLPRGDAPEVQIASVATPSQVREGEPFTVSVVVDANRETEGTVEIFRGPHRILAERKKLTIGENRLNFRQSIENERVAEFTVRLRDFADTHPDNNEERALVFASGKPRVLLIETEAKLARHIVWALGQEGIAVDVRPPQGLPRRLADLQNYELVALSNVPAHNLSEQRMELLRRWVQDLGGGLIMLGGDKSFGLGGYHKTVLEEILPVRSDFEKEKEKPSLAMVLVIDKSGSMGGQKIELAKDAAVAAIELLGAKDKIGVLAFDGSNFWVVKVTSAADRFAIVDKVRQIGAGGGTNLAPAMLSAFEALAATPAKLKHVIILTDGQSTPGDFRGIAGRMAAARMTVSTVGIGTANQQLLEEIATIGNGRTYFTTDPSSIPQIFARETISASKSAIDEEPFVPQPVRYTPALAGLDFEQAPFLLGHVITRPKPTSEVILATETGAPLLAWWRYGLGMSAAFTSDAKGRWAAEWLSWPGFQTFWAQIVRHLMRKSEARGVRVDVRREGGEATVTVDAVNENGRYLHGAETAVTVLAPDGTRRDPVAMTQTAPGRYVGRIPVDERGAYHLELEQRVAGKEPFRQTRGLVVGYPDELRMRPANVERLRMIATRSGGRFSPAIDDVFAAPAHSATKVTPLRPWLLGAALLLFVLDVALRRLDLSFGRGRGLTPRRRDGDVGSKETKRDETLPNPAT